MENQKQYPMTQEGYEKLEQELEELKTVKRPEVVEKIKVARSFGDLSQMRLKEKFRMNLQWRKHLLVKV